uniref:Prothymosin alpha n=1 Tax=Equus asinus TaxID=9793 RepID=A0A9L0JVX3_EQUAS
MYLGPPGGEPVGCPEGLARNSRARRGYRSPRAPGLQGQGSTRQLWATCSARAVRAEARAQSPPGGGCAPARRDLPAPTRSPGLRPPGGGSGRRRGPQRAVWGERGQQVPRGFSPDRAERSPSSGRSTPVCVGGRFGLAGWKKLWGFGVAAWFCSLACGLCAPREDLKEKKEVVEEAENGRDAPANGNANEENGEQEADNEVDEEEEEGGEEEEEEEEGDGEEEDGDEDEEAEAATGKRAAEDDEDDDVDTKKQKTDEDD